MAGSGEIRAKEARVRITVDGVALGGSFATVHDISVKPDATIHKKRFTGDARAKGDIDVNGWDVSFKTEKRDHLWMKLWGLIEQAELTGQPLPDISMDVTHKYRDGSGILVTDTLSGDFVLKMDENSIPKDNYHLVSWSGFCSYNTAAD